MVYAFQVRSFPSRVTSNLYSSQVITYLVQGISIILLGLLYIRSRILWLFLSGCYTPDLKYFDHSSQVIVHPIRSTSATFFESLHIRPRIFRLLFLGRYTLDPEYFSNSSGSLHTRSGILRPLFWVAAHLTRVLRLFFSDRCTSDPEYFDYSF